MKHTKKSERYVEIINDKYFAKIWNFRIQGPIKVTPDRFTLSGNSSITVSIEIYSEKVGEIVENWFAEAAIEQSPELHQLFTISVKAMLVEPRLLFSTQRVNFRIDKGSEATFYHVQGRSLESFFPCCRLKFTIRNLVEFSTNEAKPRRTHLGNSFSGNTVPKNRFRRFHHVSFLGYFIYHFRFYQYFK